MVIKFNLDYRTRIIINFNEKILSKMCNLVCEKEKIGYLFYQKLLNINEYIFNEISSPYKKDISTTIYSEISRKHRKIAKKWMKKNNYGTMGFYHTHPKTFGVQPSSLDITYFEKNSKKKKIMFYIIVIDSELKIYIYSFGKNIKEIRWMN